jgi:hypothetical protein
MATYYFDSVSGSDSTGVGSFANPWATYEGKFGSVASGDTVLFKRGTSQIIFTSFRAPRAGLSLAQPFKMAAYGEYTARPVFSFPSAAGSWGAILNGSNLSYVTIEDLDFDCTTTNANKNIAIVLNAQGTGTPTGWRVRRSRFYNSATKSGFSMSKEVSATTAALTDVIFDDCDFFSNGEHGVIAIAVSGIRYRNCRAWNNGIGAAQGGHGFSSRWNRTDVSSGWTLVSGFVYSRTLSATEELNGVTYVQSPLANRLRLTKNTGTPTTPGLDEFGVVGPTLYVNIGVNPNGIELRYAWGRCWNIHYEDCKAWDNRVNALSTFAEGNGFAFDDFTEDSTFKRCKSYNNQGRGFSSNRGDRNTIEDCLAYGNGLAGVGTNTSEDLKIRRSTFAANNAGNVLTPNPVSGVIQFSPDVVDAEITDCVIVGKGTDIGIDDTLFSSGTTVTGCSITNVATATTSVTPTSPISGDPLLASNYAPKTGSPLLGAGTHTSYVRDVEGKQRRNPPTVGALDRATLVPA